MKYHNGATGTIRRVVKQVSICLLFGAVVNVVVAWGCAAWSNTEESQGPNPANVQLWSSQDWWVDVDSASGFGRRSLAISVLLRRVTMDDMAAKQISWEHRLAHGDSLAL